MNAASLKRYFTLTCKVRHILIFRLSGLMRTARQRLGFLIQFQSFFISNVKKTHQLQLQVKILCKSQAAAQTNPLKDQKDQP